MTRILGLTLLVSAWVVVLIGMRFENLVIPLGREPVSIAYLGVPLLGAALFLLLRSMAFRKPRD